MAEHKAKLIIDLGNSQTRYSVITEDNPSVHHDFTLNNTYHNITPDVLEGIPDMYNGTVVIADDAGNLCANGPLVDNEYRLESIRPTGLEKKYSSAVTYHTFDLVWYQATQFLADKYNESVDDILIKWSMVILLPPNDVKSPNAQAMADAIKGTRTLHIAYPKHEVKIDVVNTALLSEGLAAYLGCMFTSMSTLRPGYKDFLAGSTLVIDIGAGTTDLVIIDGGRMVGTSRETIAIGGNQIETRLNQYFSTESTYGRVNSTVARNAAETGELTLGSKKFDISDKLNEIKKSVAEAISTQILDYFDSISYPLNTLAYTLVVGGGSLSNDKTTSMGTLLSEQIKKFAKNTTPMPTPEGISPRYLNLLGGIIYSEKL